jgi:zinc D-Ala-D-Ala carboxypeptidase
MISEHISFEEATKSPTAKRLGIINEPNETQLLAMKTVAGMCFEPLREWYGKPIKINSFFRCLELNKAVGGSLNSQHCKGEAIDMDAGSREENKKLYDWCKANLIFDQLIYEYGDDTGPDWVHISYKPGMNRNQTLRIK